MLSDLSVVIPTYNRQRYALRTMQYWSGKGPSIHILDGSNTAISSGELAGLGSNVVYHHMPWSLVRRFSAILPSLDTKYVVLQGDDEFYIESALANCMMYLEANPQHIACCGRALAFRPTANCIVGFEQYRAFAGYRIEHPTASERLRFHMRNYTPSLIYAVAHREVWKAGMAAYAEKEFPVFAIGELQMEMCLSVAGKSVVLPELMWLRSHGETDPIRNTDPSLDESRTFPGWWRDRRNELARSEFTEIMADTFEALLSSDRVDYKELVREGSEAYLEFVSSQRNSWRYAVGRSIPSRVKLSLRQLLQSLSMTAAREWPLREAAANLASTGVKVDFPALAEIEKIVLDFHSDRSDCVAGYREA